MPKKKAPPRHPEGEILTLSHADAGAAYQLDQLCFPPGIAFDREVFEYCLASPDCLALGVKAGKGKLLGFIILQSKGKQTAQVVTIDVQPKHRRPGLADRLRAMALSILTRNQIRRIYLQVAPDNKPGQALYRKWGFQPKSLIKDYYGEGLDALMMARELKSEEG
jgi:[ribosomal protein S18]-alanine N-acetyltransferase